MFCTCIHRHANPNVSSTDDRAASRWLGSKAGLEGLVDGASRRSDRKVAGGLVEDASPRLAGWRCRRVQQPMRVGGWVRGQSWKVGSRRKPEVIWKAKLEGWQPAKVGGWPEGTAGGSARGASRWLAQRLNRRVGHGESRWLAQRFNRRYRPEAQADGWSNGWAGRLIEGASRRKIGRLSWKIDRRRKPERGRKAEQANAAADESRRLGLKAGPEGRSKAQAGG
jgi:hypothetical protein